MGCQTHAALFGSLLHVIHPGQHWDGVGGLSTVSSLGLWYSSSGSDSGMCNLRANPAFLKQCYGVVSQAPPSPWPPQTGSVPWGFTTLEPDPIVLHTSGNKQSLNPRQHSGRTEWFL